MSAPDRQATTPVFIHSLFRSGSTYLFEVFRRSPAGYWCYQEPLNEVLLKAPFDPSVLEASPDMTTKALRHPQLSRPYLWEFTAIRNDLPRLLSKEMIYDKFFGEHPGSVRDLVDYFEALTRIAKGRPVFQECRTIGRLGGLMQAIDGVHLYLWRNPWDQWWSNRINPFFELAYLHVLNAAAPPPWVVRLRQQLRHVEFHDQVIERENEFFLARMPSAEDSYLLFYCVWCYALLRAQAAHLSINVDSLTSSPLYRTSVVTALDKLGIGGLDFSDCSSPQSPYGRHDQEFFKRVEDSAHALLRETGLPEAVALALRLRAEHPVRPDAGSCDRALGLARNQVLNAQREISGLRQHIERKDAELRDLQAELRRITQSPAWRMLAPVRWTHRLLRRTQNR